MDHGVRIHGGFTESSPSHAIPEFSEKPVTCDPHLWEEPVTCDPHLWEVRPEVGRPDSVVRLPPTPGCPLPILYIITIMRSQIHISLTPRNLHKRVRIIQRLMATGEELADDRSTA